MSPPQTVDKKNFFVLQFFLFILTYLAPRITYYSNHHPTSLSFEILRYFFLLTKNKSTKQTKIVMTLNAGVNSKAIIKLASSLTIKEFDSYNANKGSANNFTCL